jgi:serine/threonine protein phosphatase PrpC
VLVIASDGIWEYLENEDVMKILVPHLNRNDLTAAAEALLKRGVEMWGKMNFARDDITFILVRLNEVEE